MSGLILLRYAIERSVVTNHTPSVSVTSAQSLESRSDRRRPLIAGAVASALLMLGGCALTPAVAGPAVAPSVVATRSTATTSATPTPTATHSADRAAVKSATALLSSSAKAAAQVRDPLLRLKPALRKQFRACLPTTVRAGSSGTCARFLQTQLKQVGLYPWSVSSYLSVAGANAVLNYQRSRGLDADGWAGKTTWMALATKTPTVSSKLPKTCLTKGVVLCVDQAHRKLTWLRNGKVVKTFKVRLGGYNQHVKTKIWRNFPTANGTWHVYNKLVDPPSENYGSGAMPYSTMFYPDMYVHYSPGFNSVGYAGSSHGCVNIRKLSDAIWIFRNTPIGAKVHIYSPKATTA